MSEVEPSPSLTIGQAADRTGLSVHTLRFYEREGILAYPVRRGLGGRRVYGEGDLEWLAVCTRLRASGMPLSAIRRYADLVRQGTGNEQNRLALLRQHQDHVRFQIRALSECLDVISHKVRAYEDHLAQGIADCLTTQPQVDNETPGTARDDDPGQVRSAAAGYCFDA
jgi:DNA-binding transcriptional MerR regulator